MSESSELHPAWCARKHNTHLAHEGVVASEVIDVVSLRVEIYSWRTTLVTLTRVEQAMDDQWLPIIGQVNQDFVAGMPAATARRVGKRLIEAADLVDAMPPRRLTVEDAEADLRAFGNLTRAEAETLWSMYHRRAELSEQETERLLYRFETPEALRARFEGPAADGAR